MTDSKPLPQPSNTTVAPPAKSSRPYLLVLLFILVIASAGYFQFRLETVLQENVVLKQTQADLKNRLSKQVQSNAGNTALMEKTESDLVNIEQKMLGINSLIQQLPGARAEDWKLAEVEYLLRLANQRVALQQEVAGALGLFKAADAILAELDDPALLQVRELIANERLLLGNVNAFDRQGVYLSIQALKQSIKNNIQPPQHFSAETRSLNSIDEPMATSALEPNSELSSEPASLSNSESIASSLWQQLISLVQVRHREQAFDAPLNQSQYQLLEHSLLLMLEQAQWALLKQDQALFKSSIQNAISWVDGKLRHSAALQLQAELETLENIQITQDLPEVTGSLRQLRSVVQARTYRPEVKPDPIPTIEGNVEPPAPPSTTSKAKVVIKKEQA